MIAKPRPTLYAKQTPKYRSKLDRSSEPGKEDYFQDFPAGTLGLWWAKLLLFLVVVEETENATMPITVVKINSPHHFRARG